MVGQEYVNRWSRNFKAAAANFPNDDIGLGDLSLGLPTAVSSAEIMMTSSFLSLHVLTMALRINICLPLLSVQTVLLNLVRIISGDISRLFLQPGVWEKKNLLRI